MCVERALSEGPSLTATPPPTPLGAQGSMTCSPTVHVCSMGCSPTVHVCSMRCSPTVHMCGAVAKAHSPQMSTSMERLTMSAAYGMHTHAHTINVSCLSWCAAASRRRMSYLQQSTKAGQQAPDTPQPKDAVMSSPQISLPGISPIVNFKVRCGSVQQKNKQGGRYFEKQLYSVIFTSDFGFAF